MDDLDPEAVALLRHRAKAQLRKRARSLRAALPASARAARGRALAERLEASPWVERAGTVALFWPMLDRGELDLRQTGVRLRARGKRTFYPFMGGALGFREVTDDAELAARGRVFFEPAEGAHEAVPGELDAIVVPALAVSETGHRLGWGAGFYDAVLRRFAPPATSLVVAYAFELLAEVPAADHDVACDVVVTDETSFAARRG